MGGKNKGPKVYDYLLSIHAGWCHGPIDSFNQLWIKDKRVFCGALRERTNICLVQPEVFGGDEKEGGIEGVMEYYPGTVDQMSSEELASRVDLTPATMPGYRRIVHTFFRGNKALDQGFQWVTNNPYLPAFKAHLTRIPRQLNIEHSVVWPLGEEDGEIGAEGDWSLPVEPTGENLIYTYEELFPWIIGSAGIGPVRVYSAARLSGEFCDDWQDEAPRANLTFGDGEGPRIQIGDDGPEIGPLISRSPPTVLDIDSGQVTARADFTVNYIGLSPGQQIIIRIRAFAGVIDSETGEITQGGEIGTAATTFLSPDAVNTATVTVELALPVGTRFIDVGAAIFQLGIGETFRVLGRTVSLRWERMQLGYCGIIPADDDDDGAEDEPDNAGLSKMPDANPAHIIFESMTDPDWGKGEDVSFIDVPSFEAAAEVLFDERFGMSLGWFRQDTIEAFIQEILDHIKAFLFKDPSTGLWTLKLLRGDYDADTLPWLNPDNCKVRNPKRKKWGETVNEIVVTYTDPTNEEEATVSSHNLANISIQGRILSDSRNYYGVRNERLAQQLADRDVIEAGLPLWAAQVEVDRSMWAIRPGDCRRIFWPEEGIESMVVRIMSVDYGVPKDRKITLNVVEDVFGIDTLTFTGNQRSMHRDNRPAPAPVTGAMVMAPPLPEILRADGEFDASDDRYPEVPVLFMIPQTPARGIIDVEVRAPALQTDGETLASITSVVDPLDTITTPYRLPAEPMSLLPRLTVFRLGRGLLRPGALLLLGDSVADHEIIRLISYDEQTQYWSVQRAIYDTTPKVWAEGTRLWIFPDESQLDSVTRLGEDTESFWFMPRTSRGRLLPQQATLHQELIRARPYLPFRPADVAVDGVKFMPVIFDDPDAIPATVAVTWVNRNRWSEDANPVAWDADTVTPEAGQTTTVRLVSPSGDVWAENTGISGTTHTLTLAGFTSGEKLGYVEVWAERDDLESLQAHRQAIIIDLPGWDLGWGDNWDGVSLLIDTPPDYDPVDPATIDTDFVPTGYTLYDSDTRFGNTSGGSNYTRWLAGSDPILPANGRHYWEVAFTRTGAGAANGYFGVTREDRIVPDEYNTRNPVYEGMIGYRGNGSVWAFNRIGGVPEEIISGLPTYGNGDTLMFAFDAELGWFWFGKNGVWVDHPDFASPTYVFDYAQRRVPFRPTLQGRAEGEGGTILGTLETFQFRMPQTCRPLKIA